MTIDPDMMKTFRNQYLKSREETARVVAEALFQTYRAVTGKAPSNDLIDALMDATEKELRR